MLLLIREKSQGWLAWVIVILISIPFTLWGVNEYFGPNPNIEVVVVNGEEYGLQFFNRFLYQQQRQLETSQGSKFNFNDIDQKVFKRESLKLFAREQMLVQDSTENGMRIGNQQLVDAIKKTGAFSIDGKFNQKQYLINLGQLGYSREEFEEYYRRRMLMNQVGRGINRSTIVTEQEVDRMLGIQGQKRDFSWIVVTAGQDKDSQLVSDEQVESFYQANLAKFVSNEQVVVDYLELAVRDIAEGVAVSENDLQADYDEQKLNYRTGEQRKARHILRMIADDKDEEVVEKARQKTVDLLQRLNAGESFEDLAKEFSEDPGSASQGGDLGFFSKGLMDPVFEKTVYSLKKGEVSGITRTPFGFHIIKLDDIKLARTKEYAEVREDILSRLRISRAENIFYDQAERLTNIAYENPDSLEFAADELGLKILTSEMFGRAGDVGISKSPAVLRAAFDEDVLAGNNSGPVELGADHILVLRIKQHIESRQKPLADVRDDIVSRLGKRATAEAVRDRGRSLIDRLRGGESQAAIAGEAEQDWQHVAGARRDAADVPAAVLRSAFRAGTPQGSGNVYNGAPLGQGEYAVIAVTTVEGGGKGVDAAGRDTMRKNLIRIWGNAELNGFVDSVDARSEIVLYEDRL